MTSIEQRAFGATGLRVSVMGFGGGHIGGDEISDAEAARVLHRALDLGINLVDTARSYDRSEERIGRALGSRRREVILSTKIGYGVEGIADWTAEIIPAGVTEALRKLRTDYLDIVHLHSCPVDVLRGSGVVEALLREVKSGRVRVAAYSGDNEALDWAIDSGAFGSVQCSYNICDQRVGYELLPRLKRKGLGVIVKRPLANAPWRRAVRPDGPSSGMYWDRFQAMGFADWSVDWSDVALRFAAFTDGVHSCIVGTGRAEHLERNAVSVARGPLDASVARKILDSYRGHDVGWKSAI